MNKTRQWAMLTAVACLAVLAAGWFVVVKPQRTHAAALNTQTRSVHGANAQLQSQIAQLRAQQKDLPAQQKLLAQIGTKVPDDPALPSLIRQLSQAADDAGVDLVSMAPSAPAAVTLTGAAAAVPLQSIGVAINVQGTYFNIEQFFSRVESLNRAMLVNGFQLTSSTSTGAAAQSTVPTGQLTAQINASIFESAGAAPATTSTAATTAKQPATTTTGH